MTPAETVDEICRTMPSVVDFCQVLHLGGDGISTPIRFSVTFDASGYRRALDIWATENGAKLLLQ
jgi:hypothetical protein